MASGGDSSQASTWPTPSQIRVAVHKLNKDLEEFQSRDPFYHRRSVAERILREYLRDLAALNARHLANNPEDRRCRNVQKRVEKIYRVALTKMQETNANGTLTWEDRTVLKLMLEDYMEALLQDPDNLDNLEAALEEVHGNINMFTEGIPLDFSPTRFDIMTESLIASLRGVETQVAKVVSSSGSSIQVLHLQCGFLVETLSSTVHDRIRLWNETLERLLDLRVTNYELSARQRIFKSVAFCIEAMSELALQLQSVVEILNMSCKEDWWLTALELANGVPRFGIPRSSRFSLAKRECEWSMDIVELAFHALKQVLNGAATLLGVAFIWSDEKNRMVLLIDGQGEEQHMDRRARFRAMLKLKLKDRKNRNLEGEDISALVTKLVELNSADPNMQAIADFLRQKLDGSKPEVNSLPLTFRINSSSLTYVSGPVSGASGMVAKCKWLGQEVGVKTVKSLSRRRFEEQAAILATIQHPRVVRMIGCSFQEESQTGSLVMEIMEFNLRTVIEMRCPSPGPGLSPFPLTVAIDIMLQIGEGMQYLREHEVLHCDLKAMNILVNRVKGLCRASYRTLPVPLHTKEYYIAKLADFGVTEARRPQQTNVWRAPEVNDLETTNNYQWPADVYSFAMTCYEILTGRVPFDDVPEGKINEGIMAGNRPSLEEYSMPPVLKNLIQRCWATDPSERPSFAEICKSLWQCKVANILPVFSSS